MSIQPIDLQTLFVRLSQVGREQSAMKQAILQNQEVTGREIAERSRQAGESVLESEEVSEGPETVDEEGSSPQQNTPSHHEHASGEDDSNESSEDVFRDPDLGQHIDLEG
ncbi:MAG: hypothetical protein ACOCYB_04415 [Alkalispirochaeta sp.]